MRDYECRQADYEICAQDAYQYGLQLFSCPIENFCGKVFGNIATSSGTAIKPEQ